MTFTNYLDIMSIMAFIMFAVVSCHMFIKKTNIKALVITEIAFVSLLTITVSLTAFYLNQS